MIILRDNVTRKECDKKYLYCKLYNQFLNGFIIIPKEMEVVYASEDTTDILIEKADNKETKEQ